MKRLREKPQLRQQIEWSLVFILFIFRFRFTILRRHGPPIFAIVSGHDSLAMPIRIDAFARLRSNRYSDVFFAAAKISQRSAIGLIELIDRGIDYGAARQRGTPPSFSPLGKIRPSRSADRVEQGRDLQNLGDLSLRKQLFAKLKLRICRSCHNNP